MIQLTLGVSSSKMFDTTMITVRRESDQTRDPKMALSEFRAKRLCAVGRSKSPQRSPDDHARSARSAIDIGYQSQSKRAANPSGAGKYWHESWGRSLFIHKFVLSPLPSCALQ